MLEKAILSLSSLLRYTLDHKDQTTVKEEFAFLKRYCELQQLRFQDRFHYEIRYDASIQHQSIPKLLLQPLVENAIIHGIEPADQPCHLSIKGELSGEALVISIIDDGIGFDCNQLNDTESIGLKNVRDRLDLSYQGWARFELSSTPGMGTEIIIRIPLLEQNPPE